MKDKASHYQKLANDSELELIKIEKKIASCEKLNIDASRLQHSKEYFTGAAKNFSHLAQIEMKREELEETYE
ncbi:hypothetical protein CAL7716_057240 [Calothrix sp. PCC 7716]|nr:hypothetical protein CAL7716_057240 [Calothrix sp. PCC 7716]